MGSDVVEKSKGNAKKVQNENGHWITADVMREKTPQADLKRTYPRVVQICTAITFVLHTTVAVVFPSFEAQARKVDRVQRVIEIQDLPETRQIQRPPPPPRPAMPIETLSDDVPDDVTIETTSLDFDNLTVDLPPPPPGSREEVVEDEIIEFWAVEQVPVMVSSVAPVYPDVARKAGLEGTVFLEFTVGQDGRVRDAVVVRGPQIFHEAALEAVYKFVFKPAIQNDKPVRVRMTQPIRFRLTGG